VVQIRRRRRLFGGRGPKWTGRHAAGRPYVPVEPGDPDPRVRATAVLLDQLEPAWTILYGTWSRRFYAMALLLLVQATTPQALTARMRQAEQELLSIGAQERPSMGGWHHSAATAVA
jgi:hypothetical protein